MNNATQVHKLCSFTLRKNPLEPAVHFLSNSRILLTNVSSLTLTCRSRDTILTGCLNCMRNVPCNCTIKLFLQNSSLPNFFWPSKLSQCPFLSGRSDVSHIINMANLQSFFSADVLRSLSGNSYLNSTLPVTLLTFDHFQHDFHRFISADDQKSHNLHKFAKLARQRS